MPVPTPASIKKQLDQKKALESSTEVASSTRRSPKTAPEASPSSKKSVKRPKRSKHLMQRPFQENEALRAMAKTTTSKQRADRAKQRQKDRDHNVKIAWQLKEKGMSNVAIGKKMGLAESTIRSLLKTPVKTSKENN